MTTKKLTAFVITSGALLIAVALVPTTASAQKAAPVVVTNTTASPVPVTGGVAVTNTPTVDAKQSGAWNVGITGTPTVKLGPHERIQINRNSVSNSETFSWTGQGSVFSFQWTEPLERARLCVANGGPNPVVANVNALIGEQEFNLDQFQVANNVVCRVFDIPGAYLYVTVYNTGGNTTGNVRVGYWGIY